MFNMFVKQIEMWCEWFGVWEVVMLVFQKKFVDVLLLFEQEVIVLCIWLIYLFDDVFLQKGLSKVEQCMLLDLIVDMVCDLFDVSDDVMLKIIYDWYVGFVYIGYVVGVFEFVKLGWEQEFEL